MHRRSVLALGMFIAGIVLTLAGAVAIGVRMNEAAPLARETGLDFTAVFFFGADGASMAQLALVIGAGAIVIAGVVLGIVGYRRIVTPEPTPAAVPYPVHPAAHQRQIQIGR